MWLIARRTFTEGWPRLIATLAAALLSVGLMAGSLQFALRAYAGAVPPPGKLLLGVEMMTTVGAFVGLFVITNTFGTLIRQRGRRLSLLAAIGCTPRQIRLLVHCEALLAGTVAGVGGLFAGFGVSALLVRTMARDGFDISSTPVQYGWPYLLGSVGTGIVITQLAALPGVWRASRTPPLRGMAPDVRPRTWPRVLVFLAALLGMATFIGPTFAIAADSAPGIDRVVPVTIMVTMGTMCGVAGLAVLTPFFVGPLGGLIGSLGVLLRGEPGRLARTSIRRSPHRVSSAGSSLMLGVALAATAGMIMLSVHDRFQRTGRSVMTADHAVAATGRSAHGTDPLPAGTTVPGGVPLTRTRADITAQSRYHGSSGTLSVTGADPALLPGVLRLRVPALRPGEIALSSAIAHEYRLRTGDTLALRGVTLRIAGRYHDPSHLFAEQAIVAPVTMHRLDPAAATSVILVRGGSNDALRRAVAAVPGVTVYSRAGYVRAAQDGLLAQLKGIRVSAVFLLMALVIAVFGMATTVSLNVSERTREFGLLGAVGTTARQIRTLVRWEAATVVALGVLLGLGSAATTVWLIHAFTGSSFIRTDLPAWLLAAIVAGATVVTLATTALPARRAAAVPVLGQE